MLAFLFPGQGSQSRGMGQQVFDEFPELIQKADDILGYSIKTLCLLDSDQQLNQTQFTQPALFVVNALSYFKKMKETEQKPNYVAGHSLGEFNALLAAGVIDFETGLKIVKKRGELMSQAKEGSMAAVIGLTGDAIQKILEDHQIKDVVIANYNSYKQTVISGKKSEIERAESLFTQNGAEHYIILKVSGAFHSPYMKKAAQEFKQFLNGFEFHSPTIPVIANLTAKPYQPEEVKHNLSEQIASSVKWVQTIEYLNSLGVKNFEEMGPGNVLKRLLNNIQNGK